MNLYDAIFKNDLAGRTAILYEQRQISYAEIWVTNKCWPEFDESTLYEAISAYASRRRSFGGLEQGHQPFVIERYFD